MLYYPRVQVGVVVRQECCASPCRRSERKRSRVQRIIGRTNPRRDRMLPLLKPRAHCVVNVPDMRWDNERITIHVLLIEEFRERGYELRIPA